MFIKPSRKPTQALICLAYEHNKKHKSLLDCGRALLLYLLFPGTEKQWDILKGKKSQMRCHSTMRCHTDGEAIVSPFDLMQTQPQSAVRACSSIFCFVFCWFNVSLEMSSCLLLNLLYLSYLFFSDHHSTLVPLFFLVFNQLSQSSANYKWNI